MRARGFFLGGQSDDFLFKAGLDFFAGGRVPNIEPFACVHIQFVDPRFLDHADFFIGRNGKSGCEKKNATSNRNSDRAHIHADLELRNRDFLDFGFGHRTQKGAW